MPGTSKNKCFWVALYDRSLKEVFITVFYFSKAVLKVAPCPAVCLTSDNLSLSLSLEIVS